MLLNFAMSQIEEDSFLFLLLTRPEYISELPSGMPLFTGSDAARRRGCKLPRLDDIGRLQFSGKGLVWLEASPGIEPGYEDLQSSASPLRHEAIRSHNKGE